MRPTRLRSLAALAMLAAASPAQASEAVRLRSEPATLTLAGASARQQLAITGHLPDGSIRDLTGEARFSADLAGPVFVDRSGLVTPLADGSGAIRVEAGGAAIDVSVEVAEFDRVATPSYRLDVSAVLSKAGCNMGACHGNINGKGGFRLSLRGEDPAFDLAMLARDTFGRRLDPHDPARSLVVLKPTGGLPHEGGVRMAPASPEARALLGWVAAGARDDVDTAPTLRRITVFPSERISAAPSRSQQLVVTAEFADGTRRDVTRQAAYDVDDPTKASVTVDGRVEVAGPIETTVAVRYLGARAVSRLAFLADRPGFAWRELPERNAIDRAVFAKLRALKIQASPPADDATFLRRANLDALGVLPTPDEVRAFLADADPEKRRKAVERLLRRPEFADHWALKWADLLRNEEKTMGDKGVWVVQRWLRDQFAADVPLDAFARRLIATTGSTHANPPASFHRTNRDPLTAAETVGQVFLGVRLQCARCHNHPFDVWTQDDYFGLAAHFANVKRKQVDNQRRDSFDTHEVNGDEIIYLAGAPTLNHPRTGSRLRPKALGNVATTAEGDPDALDDLARWLTRDNRQFARVMANRVWFHLAGRGVVEPVDDFRDSNPPSNPELLEVLTDELIRNGMRLRPLVAFIMDSTTYALGAEPDPTNADDVANFSRATVKLLPAEVLLDAIGQALDRPESFDGAPKRARTVQLPGARMGGPFLKVFGKPDRLLTCECERAESTTLAQAFQLLNGESIRAKLQAPDNRIGRLLAAGLDDEAILDEISLAIVGHPPDASARAGLIGHVVAASDRRKAWEDVAWALINSKEFLLRH